MSRPPTQYENHLQFAEFANALRMLETTSGRRQTITLLAGLFHRATQDVHILPYLLQGRLGPPFAAPDLGINERGIAQAIADVTGRQVAEVWQEYRRQGDLSVVAEQLLATCNPLPGARTTKSAGHALSVQQVYAVLVTIATASGKGGRRRKVAGLHDLLRHLHGAEARYVVRIIQGRLRLQIGDATIMDALSVAIVGSTTLRARIERAYSLSADLGLVAATLFSSGADALEQIHPTPGRPVLFALAERLPSPQAILQQLGRALIEPKYDGLRLQAQKDWDRIWLFTRRLEDVTASFPDIVRALRRQVTVQQVLLDGEAIGFDAQTGHYLPFQQTIRRRRTHGVEQMAATVPLQYFVFDVLRVDDIDTTGWPQYERSLKLHSVLKTEQPDQPSHPDKIVYITPQRETSNLVELERYFSATLHEGLEGIMAKRRDAPYHAGARSFDWIKLKPEYRLGLADTFDLVVVGYDRGRGKRAALGIGSLLCAVYDADLDRFRTVTRVGSGLTDIEWRRLREQLDAARVPDRPRRVETDITADVWVEPHIVLEVLAGGITRSPRHTAGKTGRAPGYALRFPRIVRIRDDRRPEDATTEAELVELAQLAAHALRSI